MISLLLAVFAPAHAAPQADPGWSRIVNGTEVKGDAFPAAVAIGFDVAQFGRQSTCSASLITPRMLVTAAHCTEEFGVPKEVILQFGVAFFTNDVNQPGGRVVPFADFRAHPDYGQTNFGGIENDIGVIVLEEDVTDVKPVWFRETPASSDDVGTPVISVGYGITSGSNQRSGGVKRRAELVVDNVDDQFLYSDAAKNPDGANVCSGDSGGPQYAQIDGAWEQWGVHSFVYSLRGGDPCMVASGSTNVGTFAPWILKQIEREHGTTDRCEINGHYLDRVCDSFCADPDPDCDLDADDDGLVSDEEFEAADRDDDGNIDEDELERAVRGGCSHTGGGVPGMATLAGLLLALRRRR